MSWFSEIDFNALFTSLFLVTFKAPASPKIPAANEISEVLIKSSDVTPSLKSAPFLLFKIGLTTLLENWSSKFSSTVSFAPPVRTLPEALK